MGGPSGGGGRLPLLLLAVPGVLPVPCGDIMTIVGRPRGDATTRPPRLPPPRPLLAEERAVNDIRADSGGGVMPRLAAVNECAPLPPLPLLPPILAPCFTFLLISRQLGNGPQK